MLLNFLNYIRAYITGKNCVRFWGHDHTIEVTCEVGTEVLKLIHPEMENSEMAILKAFDTHHLMIKRIGNKNYTQQKKTFIQIKREDF